MNNIVDRYTILTNCRNWHLERFTEANDEHVKRYHRGQANAIGKEVAVLEVKLGLKNDK